MKHNCLKMMRRKRSIPKRKKKSIGTKSNKIFTKLAQHGIKPFTHWKAATKEKSYGVGAATLNQSSIARKFYSEIPKKKKLDEHRADFHDGLSPKEKNFIICKCQSRLVRYKSLKLKAENAIRDNKLFSVFGSGNGIRNALLERGWVEKLPLAKMNLSKIKNGTLTTKQEILGEVEKLFLSNLVGKYPPNFIWRSKDEHRDMPQENLTIVNRLKTEAVWTSKQGLCCSMKRNYWFYIEDVAEVSGPRSYCTNFGEMEGFVKDYKITACTSLLKWVLSMVANDRPVFVEQGKISLNVVLFALCRCKEYLYRKENKDIDRVVTNASVGQWNNFLKKYYCIIGKNEVFQKDTENKLPLYMAYAKFLLKQMHRYRPQLSCEGCHNIWIIKPAHNSRGRGIRLASRLTVISDLLKKTTDKYVIQKYIEEPLLIHETKFDIRQYCLVTSTYPLEIWMYQDCYLKFCTQKYNLKNYHESIHLTNNAVQRKYNNCIGRHKELPRENMWDSEKYKDYLIRIDKKKVWDKIIYPGMKKSIIGVMLTCQDSLSESKNRFELYGCDFILDKGYKPWLIEINSSPDLNPTTPITAKICPAVLSDVIKVVIDRSKNHSAPTGKFECIYRQPMTVPRHRGATDLCIRGLALPNDYFFKGNIDLREHYDCCDVDIEKENNIKVLLEKIRHAHDIETIMVEPEDDRHVFAEKEQAKPARHYDNTRHSRLDKELSIEASVITSQLDELMDRICSGHSLNLKKSETGAEPILEYPDNFDLTPVHSVNAIKILLDKSLKKYFSTAAICNEDSECEFEFDRLCQKSFGVYNPHRTFDEFNERTSTLKSKHSDESSQEDPILAATKKLVNFINTKEKEYSMDN